MRAFLPACTALPTLGVLRFSIRSVLRRIAPFSSKILADRRKDCEKLPPRARVELFGRKSVPLQRRTRRRSNTMSNSIRNRLPGTVATIVSDNVVSEIVILTAAGMVTSIITTGSVKRMDLKKGDRVFAMIKATNVSVEKE